MDGSIKVFFMTLEINFEKKFGKNLSRNVNLSNYSWFNLGGPAEFFFKLSVSSTNVSSDNL